MKRDNHYLYYISMLLALSVYNINLKHTKICYEPNLKNNHIKTKSKYAKAILVHMETCQLELDMSQ